MSEKFDGRVIDARDFGVRFDKTTSDELALSAAAARVRQQGGGFIFIPSASPPEVTETEEKRWARADNLLAACRATFLVMIAEGRDAEHLNLRGTISEITKLIDPPSDDDQRT